MSEPLPPQRIVASPDELQARLAAIVASSDDAIVSKDLNGIVQSWNEGAERIFGYTAPEMIGQSINILFPPDRQDEEPKILERLRRGERVDHFETIRVHKSGRLVNVSVTISPVKGASGKIIGASKIARDITVLKRFAAERDQLLQAEQAARREAERVSRAKDEFLATLSHELRTPLNAIVGWSTLLRTGKMDARDLAEGLETIERNARTQGRLVEELLDMSRIISGKMRLDVQAVNITEVISESIETVRLAAEAKEIRLIRLLEPDVGPVTGDPNRLRQVIWNLLSNAVKFTPQGGTIQTLLRRVNAHIEFTVIDSGCGIRRELLPNLFARFVQADASTTRQHGGLGLGLAIVRHLVELHGGTVRASSEGVGRGATFVISLPVSSLHEHVRKDADESPTVPAAAPPSLLGTFDLTGVKVLIVDDEPDGRELVRRVLAAHGATVVTAESAQQAIEAIRRERPCVLLSDIGMPEQDGYSLLEQVRALPDAEGGITPAVALTAFARTEDRQRALMAGFHMHVPKPVEPAELLAVVANLAGVTRRKSSAANRH